MDRKESRREFVKKAAYSTPAILTLTAMPSFAGAGSHRSACNNGFGNGPEDCSPNPNGARYRQDEGE